MLKFLKEFFNSLFGKAVVKELEKEYLKKNDNEVSKDLIDALDETLKEKE